MADPIEAPGIRRRTLIKRAAAAGAVAWAAPVILASVRSPAGAVTGTVCYRITITPTSCETTTTAAVGLTCAVTATECGPTDEPAGQPFSRYCLSAADCSFLPFSRTFTIDPSCPCTFLAINGETNNAAGGESGCGGPCVGGSITDGGKTATFLDPGGDNCRWVAWDFVVSCPEPL